MILAGTGHRPNKLGNEFDGVGPISDRLRCQIIDLIIRLNPEAIISGMALGFDTVLAETALDQNVKLIAAIPFVGQELIWPKRQQLKYHRILNNPSVEKHIICPGGYSDRKMQIRSGLGWQ